MLYNVSDFIVLVLFLPVAMNIILPLGILAVWLVGRCFNLFTADRGEKKDETVTTKALAHS
ncbi:MAG: hypothetical protein A2X81_17485 [Desulfobacterales bacterium GWB2_56_26]|nr:MAG: hypothetical protein A2X81_17485 [Desulfobacterales bacterium GWB2_56_26]